MHKSVRSFSLSKYSSLVFVSREIRARLIVLTLTEPIFKAVPPIELINPFSVLKLFTSLLNIHNYSLRNYRYNR